VLCVLLVRFSSIGDILLTTPLVRALARRHPEARLVYVTKRAMAPLVADNPHLSDVVALQPGERKSVTVTADRRLLGHYDEAHHKWRVAAGKYAVRLGRSATDLLDEGSAAITAATFGD